MATHSDQRSPVMTHPSNEEVMVPQKEDEPKLLPCPFCGDDAEWVHAISAGGEAGIGKNRFLQCSSLDCFGPRTTAVDEDAIEQWNKRADPTGFNAPRPTPSPVTEGADRLLAIHAALDEALGDTDVSHIETDDELREAAPVQWAAKEIMTLISDRTASAMSAPAGDVSAAPRLEGSHQGEALPNGDAASRGPTHAAGDGEAEKLADEMAGWLVDAVAIATQDRTLLRGEPEENRVMTEAIYLNGKKAILTVLRSIQPPQQTENRKGGEANSNPAKSSVRGTGQHNDSPRSVTGGGALSVSADDTRRTGCATDQFSPVTHGVTTSGPASNGEVEKLADEIETLTWAICAAAAGAGKGKCDPEHCVCGGEARGIVKALHSKGFTILRAQPPQPTVVKPVAWRIKMGASDWSYGENKELVILAAQRTPPLPYEIEPLYTHPPAQPTGDAEGLTKSERFTVENCRHAMANDQIAFDLVPIIDRLNSRLAASGNITNDRGETLMNPDTNQPLTWPERWRRTQDCFIGCLSGCRTQITEPTKC